MGCCTHVHWQWAGPLNRCLALPLLLTLDTVVPGRGTLCDYHLPTGRTILQTHYRCNGNIIRSSAFRSTRSTRAQLDARTVGNRPGCTFRHAYVTCMFYRQPRCLPRLVFNPYSVQ